MRLKIKNHFIVFTTLLLINVVLVSSILFFHNKENKANCGNECMHEKKSFNADALNSITIKLM